MVTRKEIIEALMSIRMTIIMNAMPVVVETIEQR